MTTTYTPGPWRLSDTEGDKKRYVVADDTLYGQSAGVILITRVEHHRLGSSDRIAPDRIQDLNANLIAAAPDMLVALRTALTYLGDDATDDSPEARDARAVVLSAISKATGKAVF